MELSTVKEQLRTLKLYAANREIDSVLAEHKRAASLGWLSALLEREIDSRRESALQTRIKVARFPESKSIETFDFGFDPNIDEEGLKRLASLDFLTDNRIIQFLGYPGTGKTHLATAIGMRAVHQGHRVIWTTGKSLQEQIVKAKLRNNLGNLFKRILSSKLWIYDDFGLITYTRDVAEEVFDLLDKRKHSSSLILTSNRDVKDWPVVFPDVVLGSAAIDRMFENAEVYLFQGKSHRLAQTSRRKTELKES